MTHASLSLTHNSLLSFSWVFNSTIPVYILHYLSRMNDNTTNLRLPINYQIHLHKLSAICISLATPLLLVRSLIQLTWSHVLTSCLSSSLMRAHLHSILWQKSSFSNAKLLILPQIKSSFNTYAIKQTLLCIEGNKRLFLHLASLTHALGSSHTETLAHPKCSEVCYSSAPCLRLLAHGNTPFCVATISVKTFLIPRSEKLNRYKIYM